MKALTNRFTRNRQQGAVLIVALVLLLVLTVLGTAGIQDTTMEERMAGNFRDQAVALEAAEFALRHGEAELADPVQLDKLAFVAVGTDGLYDSESKLRNLIPDDTGAFGRDTPPTSFTYKSKDLVSTLPDYYIEKLIKTDHRGGSLVFPKREGIVQFYRVTSRGVGVSPNTEVILQSTFYVAE